MRKKTYLLFAGWLIAAAACAAADSTLLNLVMPGAKVVSGVHVEKTKASAFGKYVLARMQSDDQNLNNFAAMTGFDPRRDLSEVVMASTSSGDESSYLVVGRGTFDRARIVGLARNAGQPVSTYHGVDLIQHKDPEKINAVAFLDGGIAVMGDLESVQAAIDRRQSGAVASRALLDRVSRASAGNDAWFFTVGNPGQFLHGKLSDPNLNGALQGDMLQNVQEAAGGLRFGDLDVKLTAEVVARTEKDAAALADVVRFFAGMVQLNRDRGPGASQAATLLDSMQLSAQDNVMKLSLAIPEDQLENFFTQRPHKVATRFHAQH